MRRGRGRGWNLGIWALFLAAVPTPVATTRDKLQLLAMFPLYSKARYEPVSCPKRDPS